MSIRTHYSELPAEQVFVLYQMGGFANTSEQELQIKADKEYKELVVAQELIKNSQPEDEFSYCVVVFNPPAAEEAAEILLQSLNLPPTMDNILLLGQNEKTTVQEIIEINRPTRYYVEIPKDVVEQIKRREASAAQKAAEELKLYEVKSKFDELLLKSNNYIQFQNVTYTVQEPSKDVYTIKRGFEEVCEELAKKLESFIPDITSAGIDFVTLDLQKEADYTRQFAEELRNLLTNNGYDNTQKVYVTVTLNNNSKVLCAYIGSKDSDLKYLSNGFDAFKSSLPVRNRRTINYLVHSAEILGYVKVEGNKVDKSKNLVDFVAAYCKPAPILKPKHLNSSAPRKMLRTPEGYRHSGRYEIDKVVEKLNSPLKNTERTLYEATTGVSSGLNGSIQSLNKYSLNTVDVRLDDQLKFVSKYANSLNAAYSKFFNRFDIRSVLAEAIACLEDKLEVDKIMEIRARVESSGILEDVEKLLEILENPPRPVPPVMKITRKLPTVDPQAEFTKGLYKALQLAFLLSLMAMLKMILSTLVKECKGDPEKGTNPDLFNDSQDAFNDLTGKYDQKTMGDLEKMLPELAAILTPFEICSLFEGSAEKDTLEFVNSFIQKSDFSFLKDKTKEISDLEDLFIELGNSFGPEICNQLQTIRDVSLNDLCSGAERSAKVRADIMRKNDPCLTPQKINEQLAILKEAREQKYEELLKVFGDPTSIFDQQTKCGGNNPEAQPEVTPAMEFMADTTITTLFESTRMAFSSDIEGAREGMFDIELNQKGEEIDSKTSSLQEIKTLIDKLEVNTNNYKDFNDSKVIVIDYPADLKTDAEALLEKVLQEQTAAEEEGADIIAKWNELDAEIRTKQDTIKNNKPEDIEKNYKEDPNDPGYQDAYATLQQRREELQKLLDEQQNIKDEYETAQSRVNAAEVGVGLVTLINEQAPDSNVSLALTFAKEVNEVDPLSLNISIKYNPKVAEQQDSSPSIAEKYFADNVISTLEGAFGTLEQTQDFRDHLIHSVYPKILCDLVNGKLKETLTSKVFAEEYRIDPNNKDEEPIFALNRLQFVPPQNILVKNCGDTIDLLGIDNAKQSIMDSLEKMMCPNNIVAGEETGGARLEPNDLEKETIRTILRTVIRVYLLEYYFKSLVVWQNVDAITAQEPKLFEIIANYIITEMKIKYSIGKFNYYDSFYKEVVDYYNYLVDSGELNSEKITDKQESELLAFVPIIQREWSDARNDFDRILVAAGLKVDNKYVNADEEYLSETLPKFNFVNYSLGTPQENRFTELIPQGVRIRKPEVKDGNFFIESGVFVTSVDGDQYYSFDDFQQVIKQITTKEDLTEDFGYSISTCSRISLLFDLRETNKLSALEQEITEKYLEKKIQETSNGRFFISEPGNDIDLGYKFLSIPILQNFENIELSTRAKLIQDLQKKQGEVDVSIKKLVLNPVYQLFLKNCLSLDLINSFVSVYVSDSVNIFYDLADSMMTTKFELKRAFAAALSGGKYDYRDPDITMIGGNKGLFDMANVKGGGAGGGVGMMILKMIKETPLQILKGLVKTTDPNIIISSKLQEKLKKGGVEKSLKDIALPLSFAIPLTPFGLIYLGLLKPKSKDSNNPLIKDGPCKEIASTGDIAPLGS